MILGRKEEKKKRRKEEKKKRRKEEKKKRRKEEKRNKYFMKRMLRYVAIFLSVSAAVFFIPSTVLAWHPTSVVVFGDAVSDNGATYLKYKIPVSPPYWQGRFSNGPVWVEHVAHGLGLISDPNSEPFYSRNEFFYNYAQYMSVIMPEHALMNKYIPVSLNGQISEYLESDHPYEKNALVFIWIGINDYYSALCLQDEYGCNRRILRSLMRSLDRLYLSGVRHVMLLTAPVYGYKACSSFWLTRSQTASVLAAALNSNTQYAYIRSIMEKKHEDYKIMVFNVETVEKYVVTQFKVTNKPCYNNTGNYQDKVGRACSNPDDHYLWDNCFPSRVFHEYFAEAIVAALKKQGWIESHWWDFIGKVF